MTNIRDLQALSPVERSAFVGGLTDTQVLGIAYAWALWARPEQLPPPGDWLVWLILAGRGWGKTRSIAEWVRHKVDTGARRIAMVGRSAADIRDVIIEGESGILSVFPHNERPEYQPTKRRITFATGAVATAYSAQQPDLLRGPQHDCAICDELAAWPYFESWDNLLMGLRLGINPQIAIATTPRPIGILRKIMSQPDCHVTRGTTFDNLDNLATSFRRTILSKYEGTSLGRQELYAELLEDVPGALWKRSQIEATRLVEASNMDRIVVAVDPAVSANEDSDETGIIVAGRKGEHFFVLDDRSGRLTPGEWARAAVGAYHKWDADRIVAETNQGGDMVETTVRHVDGNASYKGVRASRGKVARAEPVAALSEQGRIHHVGGYSMLEDQLCTYVPGESRESPDRLDALVWAITELAALGAPAAALPAARGGRSRWRV